ncbi:Phosphoribosylaminoimidazole-succinocarboxamide synthase, chloroplastic (Fragment) [Linum perenne]
MAQSMRTLNPPKTSLCNNKDRLLISTTFRASIASFQPKSRRTYGRISASAMLPKSEHKLEKLSMDALLDDSRKEEVIGAIKGGLFNCLSETNLHLTVPGLKSKVRGKVRDIYDAGEYLVLVTTDRQSAFDRVLASIPFKGQVLNQTSLWWFDRTGHITPNAVVSLPDKNVTIARKCSVFPVEFVVRGFVTGSTDTSLWTVYNRGVRNYCGNALPDGLVKNQKLQRNIITPTTKAADHDVPVTPEEIIKLGLMTEAEYTEASEKALNLFEYGQRVALEHGLILVDTKYEFGKGSDGSILLIDEVFEFCPASLNTLLSHSADLFTEMTLS